LWELIAVRGGILLLLLTVLMEAVSQHHYSRTLQDIESRGAHQSLSESSDLEQVLIPAEKVSALGRGWYLSSKHREGREELLCWTWPSVFKTYQLQFLVNSRGDVLEFGTGDSLLESLKPATSAPAAQPPVPENTVVAESNREASRFLFHEIVRQALLMSAEEQFQLKTSSAFSPVSFSSDLTGKHWPYEVSINANDNGPVEIRVLQATAKSYVSLFQEVVAGPSAIAIQTLPETAANWMQAKFPELLSQTGYQPRVTVKSPATEIAPDVLTLQQKLDPLSQFAALRKLQLACANQEESLEVSTRLARGYAMLGSLTELNWNGNHKSFKARALIWSERAVKRWPEEAEAWYSRAYVRALCGLPELALADLNQAETLDGGMAPAWAQSLKAYCQWNTNQLEQLADTGDRQAEYLWFLALEQTGTERQQLAVAERLALNSPENWRVYAFLANSGPLGVRHESAARGLANLEQTLPQLLASFDDLPPAVRRLANQGGRNLRQPAAIERLLENMAWSQDSDWRDQLVGQLKQTRDHQPEQYPLTWQTLGELIDDFQFQQGMSLLDFHRIKLSIDTSSTIGQLKPLLQHHPLAGLMDCYSTDLNQSKAAAEKIRPALDAYHFSHGARHAERIIYYAPNLDVIRTRIERQHDAVVPDAIRQINQQGTRADLAYGTLEMLSPNCPVVAAAKVARHWSEVESDVQKWESQYPDNPEVFKQLTLKLVAAERLDDAYRTAARWAQISPEYQSFWNLSEVCRRRDDWDGQKQALLEILKLPSISLEHAQAGSSLAYGFMDRQEWTQAKPYADLAASSYSGWGLLCASEVYEGLRQWEKAEKYVRACSERYDNTQDEWYRWCRRTGHGDVDRALRLAEEKLSRPSNTDPHLIRLERAIIRQMEQDPQQAYQLISECATQTNNSYYKMVAALFAHQMGHAADRDQWLQKLADLNYDSIEVLLARNLLRVQRGEVWSPSTDELEWYVFMNSSHGEPSNAMYFIAHALQILGDERSLEWLQRCAASPSRNKYLVTLAGWELTSQGHASPLRRGTELPREDAKAIELMAQGDAIAQKNDLEQAYQKYRAALAASPRCMAALAGTAFLAFSTDRYEEADEKFAALIARAPNIPNFHLTRGRLHEAFMLPALAIQDYERGLSVDPNNKAYHNNLAWLLLAGADEEFRDIPRGVTHGKLALGRGPELEWIDLSLQATMAAAQGDFEQAIQFQEQSISRAPQMEKASAMKRLELYQQKRPYIRPLALVPLIETLPEDGTWASYELVVTMATRKIFGVDPQPAEAPPVIQRGEVIVRSVGRTTRGNQILRCLEIELVGASDLIPSTIYRLIVPEDQFGKFKHPLRQAVKIWTGQKDGPLLPINRLEDDPTLKFYLNGISKRTYASLDTSELDTPLGRMPCQVYTGWAPQQLLAESYEASWSIGRHPDFPFGLVHAKVKLLDHRQFDLELTLKAQGADAQATFPHLLLE